MLRFLLAGLVSLALTLPVTATPLAGDKTYDMLFRNGTLDDIDRDKELVYARKVTNKLKPEAERATAVTSRSVSAKARPSLRCWSFGATANIVRSAPFRRMWATR